MHAHAQEGHRGLLQQVIAATPAAGDASPPLPPPPLMTRPSDLSCDPHSQRLSLLHFFNDTGGQQWVNSSGWPEGITMHLPRMTPQDLERHMAGNRTFGNKTFAGPEGMHEWR